MYVLKRGVWIVQASSVRDRSPACLFLVQIVFFPADFSLPVCWYALADKLVFFFVFCLNDSLKSYGSSMRMCGCSKSYVHKCYLDVL